MKVESYEELGVNVKVEIFDLDMRETILLCIKAFVVYKHDNLRNINCFTYYI